jgi:hypothetical protein
MFSGRQHAMTRFFLMILHDQESVIFAHEFQGKLPQLDFCTPNNFVFTSAAD